MNRHPGSTGLNLCLVSPNEWTERVHSAALDVASAAEHGSLDRTMVEDVAGLLVTLGKAAGHADQLALQGSAARAARRHFRRHMLDVGATAMLILRSSREQRGLPVPAVEELAHEIARRRVISARGTQAHELRSPAGHAAAGLGAAIAAVGRVVPLLPLDQERQAECATIMEAVLAAAITAAALAPREPI